MPSDSESSREGASLLARSAPWIYALWVALSCVSLIDNTDLWTNLRVGEDILAGAFPDVERYSATAAGRPFVAFEWGASVLFAALHASLGPEALTVLRVALVLGVLALVYAALPPSTRSSGATLPFFFLASYPLCWRGVLRPHLLSLLLVAALTFALERWRRTRRWQEIVWLVPMHLLWVNLHGAYLFGLALLVGIAGLVTVLHFVPQLGEEGEPPWTLGEAGQLWGVTLASALACLANPYGARIFRFSFELSEGSEFIKRNVLEWQNTFGIGSAWPMAWDAPWFWGYCALLVALWAGLLLRVRQRPLLDAAIALVISYQSARANRFVAYLAILGLPIVLRSWAPLVDRVLGTRPKLARGLALAVVVAMVVTAAGPGTLLGPRGFRQWGLGFGGVQPYESVDFMEAKRYRGVLYNEYSDGGLVIYRLYPHVRPVMDARIDLYGEELFEEYEAADTSPERMLAYLRKYDINLALFYKQPERRPIVEAMIREASWRPVHQTPLRVLLVRDSR